MTAPAAPPVTIERFDVSELPEGERFGALVAANSSSRLTRLSDGPFAASARFWRLGRTVWVDQWLDPLRFERDEQMARSLDASHYSLIVMLAGRCTLVRRPRDVVCRPGDVILTDVSEPEVAEATRVHSLHIRIPREELDAVRPPVDHHGRLPRSPATRLFVRHAAAVAEAADGIDEAQGVLLSGATCRLLAAALSGLPTRAAERERSPRERVRRYIADHPDGALDVARLCAARGMTRATLYRAFKADGGLFAYDRKRRLVGLHQALTNPTERRSLAELGYAFGFPDKSGLSRAFRAAFGYSASELRAHASARPGVAAAPGSLQERFREAVRSLG